MVTGLRGDDEKRDDDMLSRTAENLFWMARYMERAEATARLLTMAVQRCPVSHEDKAVVERICRERKHTATNAQRAALEAAPVRLQASSCTCFRRYLLYVYFLKISVTN